MASGIIEVFEVSVECIWFQPVLWARRDEEKVEQSVILKGLADHSQRSTLRLLHHNEYQAYYVRGRIVILHFHRTVKCRIFISAYDIPTSVVRIMTTQTEFLQSVFR